MAELEAMEVGTIFEGVTFFLDSGLAEDTYHLIKALLERGGAKDWRDNGRTIAEEFPASFRFDPFQTTHIITTTNNFPEYQACIDPQADGVWEPAKLKERAVVVSPEWVRRSYSLRERQPERFFSADPARIFSGIIVHASRLSKQEAELLYGAVQSLGGGYRMHLTKEVTHLVTPVEESTKLMALRASKLTEGDHGILAVHPAWINESVKYNCLVDAGPFTWPLHDAGRPAVLTNILRDAPFVDTPDKKGPRNNGPVSLSDRLTFAEIVGSLEGQKDLFKPQHAEEAALGEENRYQSNNDDSPSKSKASSKRFFKYRHAFQGKKILYAVKHTHEDAGRALDMLAFKIKEHGGDWIPPPFGEADLQTAVMKADIVITTYRDEPAAYWAFWHGKQLATINWVWNVITSGRFVSSLDNVLHFPPPSGIVPGFDKFVITVSNYTGEIRSYIKSLIIQMGGQWTPDMSSANNMCVSSMLAGDKVSKAAEWEIPIVNHFWLEDCFIRWQALDRAEPAYRDFSPGVNLSKVVGTAKLDLDVLKPWTKQAEAWTKDKGRQNRANQDTYEIDRILARRKEQAHKAREAAAAKEAAEAEAQTTRAKGRAPSGQKKKRAAGEDEGEEDGDEADETVEAAAADPTVIDETVFVDQEVLMDVDTGDDSGVSPVRSAKTSPSKSQGKNTPAGSHKDGGRTPTSMVEDSPTKLKRKAKEVQEIIEPEDDSDEDEDELEEEVQTAKPAAKSSKSKPKRPTPIMQLARKRKAPAKKATPKKKDNASQATSSASQVSGSVKKKPRISTGVRRYYATTMADSITEAVQKTFLQQFGWELADSITEEVEVLVAGRLNRSEKTCCAILQGIDIVNEDWVFKSIASGADEVLEPSKFALLDKQEEKKRGFSLEQALDKSRKRKEPLFDGHSFYFSKNMKPDPDILRRIVSMGGGTALATTGVDTEKLIKYPDTFHYISSTEDKKVYQLLRDDQDINGEPVCVWSGELILKAVLHQKIDWRSDLLMPSKK